METVWLVCEWQGGRWWPRQDLPPAFDEEVAVRFARAQTQASGLEHQAKPFRSIHKPIELRKDGKGR